MSEIRPTVAVDLDGVLAHYDGWKGLDMIGRPLDGAVEFVQTLIASGFAVQVHTTRTNVDASKPELDGLRRMDGDKARQYAGRIIASWLSMHGFPALSSNFGVYTGEGKPLACAYVDDRAVACRPQERGPEAFADAAERIEALRPS